MTEKTTSSALVLLNDPQIATSGGNLTNVKATTLAHLAQIPLLERDAAIRAILAGLGLHRIKLGLKHGLWTDWCDENASVSRTQIRMYMGLAAVFLAKCKINKPELIDLLTAGEADFSSSSTACSTAFGTLITFCANSSLNELLCEHHLKPSTKLGGARDAAALKPASQNPEQLYLLARDEIGSVLDRAEALFIKENRLQHMAGHPEEIRGVVDGLRALADKVDAAAKPLLRKNPMK